MLGGLAIIVPAAVAAATAPAPPPVISPAAPTEARAPLVTPSPGAAPLVTPTIADRGLGKG